MSHDQSSFTPCLFQGDGEMARAVNQKDWSATLVGPPSSWPPSIRTAVRLSLDSEFQIFVLAGPELVYIYNDATIPVFGDKHPWALGQRVEDVWPEAWHTLQPMLASVLETGRTTSHKDLLLVLNRSGFDEECYFTLSYSPVREEDGSIVGVLVATTETTAQVLGERRRRTLADLATRVARRAQEETAFETVREVLSANQYDLPFTALYLADPDGAQARLAFCTGLRGGAPNLPGSVALGAGPHPLAQVAQSGEAQLVAAAPLLDGAECGAWPEPPRQLLVAPVMTPGRATARGLLLAALNPRAHAVPGYLDFLAAAAGVVGIAVANADAVGQRTAALRDATSLLAAVFDRAPGGIAIICTDGVYLRVNPAYEALLGYPEAQLAGRRLAELVDPADFDEVSPHLRQLVAGVTESYQCEVRYRCANGRVIWVHNFMSVIADHQGRPRYFVQIAKDVSGRRAVEAERQSAQEELRQLYQLLQTVRENERTALAREVHDQLGQILSAAKIDLRLLENDLLQPDATPDRERVVAELRSASATLDRAVRLVRDIATELRAPSLDGQGLYAAIEWHARDFERRTRIPTRLELATGLPQPARAAAEALLRIFLEALTNVLRHAHAGGVWVCLDRRADMLLLRVRDDGVGIARQRARRGGSLGLTGMRERAALAGGRLAVGSLSPRGTLVSALLPLNCNTTGTTT